MSISSPLNNLYVDQYFPTEPTQPLGTEIPSEGSYESFEDEFLGGGDMEVVEESANSGVLEGDTEAEEEVLEPSSGQKSTMKWLDEHGQDLEEDFFAAQERLAELLDGVEEMKPEKRKEKLEEVESTLDEIERELKKYAGKEESIRDSELPEELWEFDSAIDAESMEDELDSIRKDLGEAIDGAETAATEEAEAEAKVEQEETEGRELKDQLSDLLGYLNGAKDKLYFTANVWGKKHIKDYHEDVTQYALGIVSQMADAAVSGNWDTVISTVEGLDSGAADNTLGLVGFLFKEFCPQVLDKIPSQVLEAMSDAILRGNNPSDGNIYYINQDGKYDGPKDDRRRKDMGHADFTYQEAAEIFQSKADTNRTREESEAEAEAEAEAEGEESDEEVDAEMEEEEV